jgi:hypothetical protein
MSTFRGKVRLRLLSRRWQLLTIVILWTVLAVPSAAIHRAFVKEYYHIEETRLETIASTAAYSGARLLPSHPSAARRTANAYAEENGIPPSDIVLVEVSSDQRSLMVELGYKIPVAFALFGWSGSQYLRVTARANLQPA